MTSHTIASTLAQAQQQLLEAGVDDSPKLDAEILLAHSLKQNRTYLFTWSDKTLSDEESRQFSTYLKQRCSGHPIAHITGQREFWGLPLTVSQDTLIPRPDTETLVEAVLELTEPHQPDFDGAILDLGTGTGAIALALKSELSKANVDAVDQSQAALNIARQNADSLNLAVTFIQSDWFSALDTEKRWQFIVSNPPYIEENDPHLEQGDVRFEPLTALTAGADGLDDIRLICQQAPYYLTDKGWLLIEHGYNQANAVADIFKENGLTAVTLKRDLANQPRITMGQWRSSKR